MNNSSSASTRERLLLTLAFTAMIVSSAGGHWDGWLHAKQGHTLLAIPHLIILAGFFLFGITGALALFLLKTDSGSRLKRGQCRGTWLVAIGGLGVPGAAFFDQAWHWVLGEDQTIWSLPHVLLLFFAALIFFGGALTIVSRRSHAQFAWVKSSDWPALLLLGTMLLPFFIAFAEFDQPILSWLSNVRPGHIYPVTTSLAATFLLVAIASILKRYGAVTAVALGAYLLYSGSSFVVSLTVDYYDMLPSFPIVIPALALDTCLYLSRRWVNLSFSKLSEYLILCALTATVSYWTVIAWASLYTQGKLPQQLSGSIENWAAWYGMILGMSVAVAVFTRALVQWSLACRQSSD